MTKKGAKASILVVDDMPDNLRVLTEMLNQQGYEARPIPNGQLALRAIEADPPDLILLDIDMPPPNGYEICQELKAHENTAAIPVIFISALDEVLDKVTAFSVGGVDYISKPFQFEEVLARIHTHLTLQGLQNQLKRSNADLENFAHTVAHDLKAPLGSITGYAGYLLEALDDLERDRILDLLRYIEKAGRNMSNIIDEILLLASIRSDHCEFKVLNMAQIVAQAQYRLAYMLEQYQADLQAPTEWPKAIGHASWVEEIWANYISNGLKYGGNPPLLTLGAKILPNAQIRFWVRDNGPGLTEVEQSQLFKQFARLDESRARGSGLGLSIVQRIVERLGGVVGVDSIPGQGSEFYFTLPIFGPSD